MNSSPNNQVICFGEMLWDILPSGALPGGAPMNVAYHLNKLGTRAALITRIGKDDYGKKLLAILENSGVPTDFVEVDDQYPTGLVYANPNDLNEVVYDIVYPSAWDYIEEKEAFKKAVSQAPVFIFGSLASRNKVSRDTLSNLLDLAQTRVLDINLRAPHFEQNNLEYLLTKADILKMNIAELELITGWYAEFKDAQDRIKFIQDRFDIKTVIVTMGADGAMINDKGRLYTHHGFKVEVADTIGSGDAFLAGYIHKTCKKATAEEALIFASAMGAFVATQSGACPVYQDADIEKLIMQGANKDVVNT